MLKTALICLAVVSVGHAKLRILDNDDDDKLCIMARCRDGEMCVIDEDTDKVTCVHTMKLQQYIKQRDLKNSPHPRPVEPTEAPKSTRHHIPSLGKAVYPPKPMFNRPRPAYLVTPEAEFHDRHVPGCSHGEAMRMGGRLLKWFKDVHTQEPGVDRTLRAHKVTCKPEVAWMFQQWDGNNDGQLTHAEMRPMENSGTEKCVRFFINMCDDTVIDDQISIDEWCDCFSYAHDYAHEPPCHKAKHETDPHLLGVFLPRCDLEGFYKPEQCHEGSCWCVDRYGREFDKSRVQNTLPDCGQYASDMTEESIADLRARM